MYKIGEDALPELMARKNQKEWIDTIITGVGVVILGGILLMFINLLSV